MTQREMTIGAFDPREVEITAKRILLIAGDLYQFVERAEEKWTSNGRELTLAEDAWLRWLGTYSSVLEIYGERCAELAKDINKECGEANK